MWTAATVRSPQTLGYTYSDLGNGSISAVKAAVNRLYGRSAGSGGISKRSGDARVNVQRELPEAAVENASVTAPEDIIDGRNRQYLANILSQKFALNGSYGIYLFMGDFDDDPASWPQSPNLVGTHAVFAALSTADAASNPQARTKRDGSLIHVTGAMPLTSMLLAKVDAGDISCMNPETVIPYLTDNLHWRVGMVSHLPDNPDHQPDK